MTRKHVLEAATLIIAAVLCAVVANAFAARDRKIALVGTYPNALKVPAAEAETTTAPSAATSAIPDAPPPVTITAPLGSMTATTPTTTALPVTTTSRAPMTPPAATTGTQLPRTATTPAPPPPQPATTSPGSPVGSPTGNTRPDFAKYVPHPDKAYIEVPYTDVAALHAGGALFLDARRTSVYEQGHIAGARPFAVWESDVEDKVRKLWEQRQDPKEQALPIVIYCTGGDCEDSHMLAQKLWGAQFNNVYVYKDGFPDWQAHQGAVHAGMNP